MAERCWCGENLKSRPYNATIGGQSITYTITKCPTHSIRYQVPPDGLVPVLVEAVRAMVNEPFTEAYNRAIAALAALDQAKGEEARDALHPDS